MTSRRDGAVYAALWATFVVGAPLEAQGPKTSPSQIPGSDAVQATVAWREGSLGLAMGETLLANFVPWILGEYLMRWKDITRISPTTWRENVRAGPVWDDNHLSVNWILHPYQGSHYFVAGRSNGYGYEKSFLFTLAGSTLWECCGESHRPSKSDLVTTTLGGSVLGEVLYRVSSQVHRSRASSYKVVRFATHVVTPMRWLTHEVLDRPSVISPDAASPERPDYWNAVALAGWNRENRSGFLELRYTYDDFANVRWGRRPFSHFGAAFGLTVRKRSDRPYLPGKSAVDLFQARGILWPFFGRQWPTFGLVVTPFQGIDYINKDAYEFGAQSLGVSVALTVGDVSSWNLAAIGDGHMAFGAVDSEYAHLGQIHDRREREREYDFTWGPGWGLGLHGGWYKLRATGYYRWNRMLVVDGSNIDGYSARHRTQQAGIRLNASRLLGNAGLGADLRYFARTSNFLNPTFAPVPAGTDRQLRVYLTWDTHPQPRSLFLF